MLVGQDFARDTLRLDQRVEFRKTKVYYMEGLNSSLCPKVDDEMLVCLKNVSGFFSKNAWILQRNIRTHSFDYFWMHFEIWSLKCSGVYGARCFKLEKACLIRPSRGGTGWNGNGNLAVLLDRWSNSSTKNSMYYQYLRVGMIYVPIASTENALYSQYLLYHVVLFYLSNHL